MDTDKDMNPQLLMSNDTQRPSDFIIPHLSVNTIKADTGCVFYWISPPVDSANALCGGYLLQSSATLNTFVLPECFI